MYESAQRTLNAAAESAFLAGQYLVLRSINFNITFISTLFLV